MKLLIRRHVDSSPASCRSSWIDKSLGVLESLGVINDDRGDPRKESVTDLRLSTNVNTERRQENK